MCARSASHSFKTLNLAWKNAINLSYESYDSKFQIIQNNVLEIVPCLTYHI